MHRLFVGLRPPPLVRKHLIAINSPLPHARWQDDGQLHCTLRFIGEVDRRRADDIALALTAVHAAPLDIAIAGVGLFRTGDRPTALWAGLAPRDAVTALHCKVDIALARAGVAPDRRAYLPHITLARLNRSTGPTEPWLADHAGLATPRFTLSEMLLYESRLGRGGASYDIVARYPLAR